ncbi:hypothetical protein ARMSODRAFT_897445 [Armillaria solidipes]|uniref:Uncharacterized protein n=1 Tax=Armillaria solidipes TaxID=1076256 RepID=A0A2H3APV6_9AGAR|nr:hypothetical protein ARMSODRAFT_897445 [Armillaria solidipes]
MSSVQRHLYRELTSREDWHEIWCNSVDFTTVRIQEIHVKERFQPAVGTMLHSEYATSWFHQMVQLVERDAADHVGDLNYMMAKMALNTVSGLSFGFSFLLKDTQQGTQNKLFLMFMCTIISVPPINQLPFLNMRSVHEIRECPMSWDIIGSSLFFFCWYWTSEFTSDHAGCSSLMIGVVFPLYYAAIGQSVAAMSPDAEIAAILFSRSCLLCTYVFIISCRALSTTSIIDYYSHMTTRRSDSFKGDRNERSHMFR